MYPAHSGALEWYEGMSQDAYEFQRLEGEAIDHLRYLHKLKIDMVGMEGIMNGLTRLFAGILNTIMHIVHTFKTNTLKFYKTLKRTELVYYQESNVVSVKRIFNFDYGMMSTLDVPIPNKMVGTYQAVAAAGIECLNTLNMVPRAEVFVKQTQQLRDRILSGSQDNIQLLTVDTTDLKVIQTVFTRFDRCFVGPTVQTKKFSELFPNPDDFKKTFDMLIGAADHQYSVQRVDALLDQATNNLTQTLAFLEKNTGVLTKDDLTALSASAMMYAKLFDMFGVSIQDMSRVEHNYVEVMKAVRSNFNL